MYSIIIYGWSLKLDNYKLSGEAVTKTRNWYRACTYDAMTLKLPVNNQNLAVEVGSQRGVSIFTITLELFGE